MKAQVEYSAPRLPSKMDMTQGWTGREVGAGMINTPLLILNFRVGVKRKNASNYMQNHSLNNCRYYK